MRFISCSKPAWPVLLMLVTALFSSCREQGASKTITVKNNLAIPRTAETISIPVTQVKELIKAYGAANLLIKAVGTDNSLVSQTIDNNGDGQLDEIIFQTDIPANAEQKFTISGSERAAPLKTKSKVATYSRFVPERTDDYAWENDRVAFRTYGPVAQQLVEKDKPGGTLTSGMDAWLKKVNYPIINKWYQNNLRESGYYHQDHGEGYDPYHVGASRGIGGIGVLVADSLYVSKNFTGYKKLAEGPIRTLFELTYAPWQANGQLVNEKKLISLDLGSNLTRFEVSLASEQPLPNATIGLTLHENKGEAKANPQAGWFRYWEPMDDAFLGTALVVAPTFTQTFTEHQVKQKDQSHLYVIAKPQKGKLVYYAGFGWTKSNQFKNQADWDAYLANYAQRLASPLQIAME